MIMCRLAEHALDAIYVTTGITISSVQPARHSLLAFQPVAEGAPYLILINCNAVFWTQLESISVKFPGRSGVGRDMKCPMSISQLLLIVSITALYPWFFLSLRKHLPQI